MAKFFDALALMRQGETITDLDKRLSEVVAAVRATGKAGKVNLCLIIKPAGRGESVALTLEDQVKIVLPSMDKGTTILYADKDNQLSKRDPRQMELEGLRVVAMPEPAELREVNNG